MTLEDVTKLIQTMREEQTSFLDQQREVIVQQVLKSIQQSVGSGSSSFRDLVSAKPVSSVLSLAESGLDHPQVHSSPHLKGNSKAEGAKHFQCDKLKPSGRREVESSKFVSLKPSSKREHEKNNQEHVITSQQLITSISQSPLKSTYRTKGFFGAKRRGHIRSNGLDAISHTNVTDESYLDFVDPIDAAFAAVSKKVDLRTLAILDRSKMLLDEVKYKSITDGKNGFVEKLRQRHANANVTRSRLIGHADENKENVDCNQPSKQQGKEPLGLVKVTKDDAISENDTHKISADDIRCDLELLQPPAKAPDNDNEWENELARQILTIYATSVKAKALNKSSFDGPETSQNDDQTSGIRKDNYEKQRQQRHRVSNNPNMLPAIGKKSLQSSNKRTFSSSATICCSWEQSQLRNDGKVIINMPKIPRPIWFAGTGAIKAVWCALADGLSHLQPHYKNAESPIPSVSMCDHQLCEEIRQLEAKKKFGQCIETLESLLIALVRARGIHELEIKLWKQLVVTCNAFASRCIDYRKFSAGLQLMKRAEQLIDNSILVNTSLRMELLAYLYDTYAHYYYKRRKAHAGLQYIMKAHEIHSRQSSWSHLAKCRLHIANLFSFQHKHTQAMKYMASILEMIEENKLEETSSKEVGTGSAQKLCLAAVCYNNLAVEQLHMRHFEAASVSSSNAQRLAKLCLSYSSRWLQQLQATSNSVDLAIATLMEDTNDGMDPELNQECK